MVIMAMMCHCMIWCVMVLYGMMYHGMVCYDVPWLVWYDMV